jgi:hypothetical protein
VRLPAISVRRSTLFYLAVALLASSPAWIVEHPPLQDLPLHLATIRTVRSFHDPAFGFDQSFVLTFGRTQYVGYHVVGALLSWVVGVPAANVLLVSFYLAGTVLSVRSLLRALGRDERLCLLVLPLLVNTMFIYGLLPFLVGIPLMLWALAAAIVHFRNPHLGSDALLCVLALALFYSHIVPFGVFCIGAVALFPWLARERWWRCAAPLLPATLALLWWTVATEAGRLSRGAANDTDYPRQAVEGAVEDLPNWFTAVLRDRTDLLAVVGLGGVVFAAFLLARRAPPTPFPRAYIVLPLSCILLYFVLPPGHGYIWLVSQRFPILYAITVIPLVPMPEGKRGVLVSACALVAGLAAIANTCLHFIRFEREEVGDFDEAIESMQGDRKVCALVFDNRSAILNNYPFLHFGSYYQAAKGGVVMFTFAGYAHWPVDFQPSKYPPPGGPARRGWEWTPQKVPMSEIYPYYDYVLTRGGDFRPPAGTYRVTWHGGRWTVWAREPS